jgi:uncharacterized membrane protein (UPF0127 family)
MQSFLVPLIDAEAGTMILRNSRTGVVIADRVIPAFDSRARRTGLLRRTGLSPGEAMIIAPTNAIHTFFMQFPIDVAFVDRSGRVVKICNGVKPWRIAWAWGAYAVIEMSDNALAAGSTRGDRLYVDRAGS